MEIVLKPEMTVLQYRVQTTMEQLANHCAATQELIADAVSNKMIVCGCVYWIYRGCDGDMSKPFELCIALPVNITGPVSSKFEVVKHPAFKCVTRTHVGAWSGFHGFYASLVEDIARSGLTMGSENREVYLNCDFQNQDNCITEVQVEIL